MEFGGRPRVPGPVRCLHLGDAAATASPPNITHDCFKQRAVRAAVGLEGGHASRRAWIPGNLAGPSPITVRPDGTVIDLAASCPTVSVFLEWDDVAGTVRTAATTATGRAIGTIEALLSNSRPDYDDAKPRLLAPCDLQAIKAAGVTFIASTLERVIEEQARGDASRAEGIRARLTGILGDNLASVRPGSEEAARIKQVLVEQGAWSQYLEVGIGPDARFSPRHNRWPQWATAS